MFSSKAKEEFDIDVLFSLQMEKEIKKWERIYAGFPDWVDKEEEIKTINFAKTVTSETARLACLDLSIKLDGSARAEYIQTVIDNMFDKIREYVEKCGVCGTVVLKPNGSGVECLDPSRFLVTETDGNNIRGMIFFDYYNVSNRYYTRMEYHRFVGENYFVSNRCYMSKSKGTLGEKINIANSPWRELSEDTYIENLEKPLYAVLKTPMANHIDPASPLGISIFAEGIEELKDLDIAYSRNTGEIKDSRRMVLVDERMIKLPSVRDENGNVLQRAMKMPKYIRKVMASDNADDFYQEVNPQLNTTVRIEGINNILSILAYKCGYSNGYFSFDAMQGIQTATGVEVSQQRTIQFIKDIRDRLQAAMDDLIYSIDKYADLYDLAPLGEYEVVYGFGDICYSYEEDKKTWWGYVQAGKVPFWKYLTKFENMSEEEAKELEAAGKEANKPDDGLFGEE